MPLRMISATAALHKRGSSWTNAIPAAATANARSARTRTTGMKRGPMSPARLRDDGRHIVDQYLSVEAVQLGRGRNRTPTTATQIHAVACEDRHQLRVVF